MGTEAMGDDAADGAPIRYESLVAEFQEGLLNALRGHAVGFDYLEIWVPDPDPVKGVLNMAESAEIMGTSSISVIVRRETLPAERDDELLGLLSALGTASIRPSPGADDPNGAGEAVVVTVSGLGAAQAVRQAHPSLKNGLARRLAALQYEGATAEETPDAVRIAAGAGAMELVLSVSPDTGLIRAAGHRGGREPIERAVLDTLCDVAIGTPVDDAAEHGLIRALAALTDPDQPRGVAGISLPINADPAFLPVLQAVRAIRDDYRRRFPRPDAYNEFDLPPSRSWSETDAAARKTGLDAGTAAFIAAEGLQEHAIQVLRLDNDLHGRPVRAVVTFAEEIPPRDKPRLMRALERSLKVNVERTLQLHHEQLKDQNAIRRL